MKKNRVKHIVIAAAAYAVYVLAAGLSRGYITPITALGDLIVPFGYGGTNPGGSRFGRVSKLALWNFLTKGIA